MKFCNKCKISKPFSEFSRRGKGYQSWCKLCNSTHHKDRWKKDPSRRDKLKQWTEANKLRTQEFVFSYLQENPCYKCGETNPLVLQFDHIQNKEFEIGLVVTQGYSIDRIKVEIEKCQVLCANCHSIKTAHQLGNWKLKWLARSESN